MARRFIPARFPAGEAPDTQSMEYDTAETFKRGAVVIFEGGATGQIVESSADSTPIVGVSMEDVDSKPGHELGHTSQIKQVTARKDEVSVAKANRVQVFSGRMVNGSTDPVTPALTDVNVLYGLLKTGNDWVVDQAEVANTRVEITDIDITEKIVYFKFMEAHLAQP